ncbi:MAG TPA: hypothetical protein VJY33_04175 [Isosphaeraceae bacterium]|nr:hypothetical protein [Isosphaeraceae bacterium]
MSVVTCLLSAMLCSQTPASMPQPPAAPAAVFPQLPATTTPAPLNSSAPAAAAPTYGPIAPADVQETPVFGAGATPVTGGTFTAPTIMPQADRGLFESDHAFDGFTTPLSNPVQSKDPRSLT